MKLGLKFAETLRGHWHRLDAPTEERAIDLSLEIRIGAWHDLALDPVASVTGRLRAEGLASDAIVEGTLGLRLAQDRRAPYDLVFVGDDGARYRLRAQRELMMLGVVETLTTLPASVYDAAGHEIGRATLRFDARADLGRLVRSLRPTLGR